MNILLINHYAGNPILGMSFRPYYLSREWIKQGHSVTIAGGSFSHLRYRQPEITKDFTTDIIDGVNYVWLKTPSYPNSGLKRFISMLVFVFKLFWYRKRFVKLFNPDVVIASSTYPLDIFPSRSIAKKSNAKLCFELHDLWPLSPMLIGGFSKWHPFIMLMQAGENYACRQSDVIVSLLDNAKAHLMKHGMTAEKFHCVPNGFVMSEYVERENIPEKHEKIIGELKQQNKLLVGYAGGFNPSTAMHILVEAAKKLSSNQNLAFVCVGKGPECKSLNKLVKDNNLDNFFILEPVNKKAVSTFLREMDILYSGSKKSEIEKHGISPNKLVDYMLSVKPVVLSRDLVVDNLTTKLSCGITVPAEDADAVANAIEKLISYTEQERMEMGQRGFKYAYNNLNYETLSQKFIEILINS